MNTLDAPQHIKHFWEKYAIDESFGEEGYLDKNSDNLRIVHKFWNDAPNKIWSVYDSGHYVCGYHFVNVMGYFITTEDGQCGEEYFDEELAGLV